VDRKRGTRESVIERILWLDEMSDLTYVIDVNANKLPYAKTISEYKVALDTEEAIMLDKDPFQELLMRYYCQRRLKP